MQCNFEILSKPKNDYCLNFLRSIPLLKIYRGAWLIMMILAKRSSQWSKMTFESGIRDRSQILLLTIIKFELINFYPPWNSQKTYGILMISEEIGVNLFIWKMSSNPEMTLSGSWSNSQELCWYQTCAEKAWFTLGRRGPNSEIFLIFALNVDIFRQRLLNVHAQSFNKETGSALQTSPFSPNFYRYILSSKRGNKIFIFFGYLRQIKI